MGFLVQGLFFGVFLGGGGDWQCNLLFKESVIYHCPSRINKYTDKHAEHTLEIMYATNKCSLNICFRLSCDESRNMHRKACFEEYFHPLVGLW